MKPLRLMLAAAVLTWTVAAQAVGWVGIPLINGGGELVTVPNVVGLSATDADTALEADGLDTGTVTMRCSGEPLDEVLEQNPAAGSFVSVGALVDLETSTGSGCLWDLTGIPAGWYSIANALADRDFVAIMREEASNNATWAYWLPGAPRGTATLRLDLQVIRDEADGDAEWARWAPGTTGNNSGNLQLNLQEALTVDFQ